MNDLIHGVQTLRKNLFEILMGFRRNSLALICDISEMYLQINLRPRDCKYLRFFCWQMDQLKKPSCYEIQKLVFGLNFEPLKLITFLRRNQRKINKNSHLLRKLLLRAHTWTIVWTVW